MSQEYASPVFDVRECLNKMLHTDIDSVSFVRKRRIQCVDGSLCVAFEKPRKVLLRCGTSDDSTHDIVASADELTVVITSSVPLENIPDSSSFERTVTNNQRGTTLTYRLFGSSEIEEFLSRLPYKLPFTSVTHVVQSSGYMKMASFIQHLDCGDSWYSCITVDNYVRNLVKDHGFLLLRMQ